MIPTLGDEFDMISFSTLKDFSLIPANFLQIFILISQQERSISDVKYPATGLNSGLMAEVLTQSLPSLLLSTKEFLDRILNLSRNIFPSDVVCN
jgi:membrane associated rhomboid family serine protease